MTSGPMLFLGVDEDRARSKTTTEAVFRDFEVKAKRSLGFPQLCTSPVTLFHPLLPCCGLPAQPPALAG
jgi:hypothetical protein